MSQFNLRHFKKIIKDLLPDPDLIKNHQHLKLFGKLLHDPNLWHLHRRSVARAAMVGLFVCYLPIPAQMLTAACFAIGCRANIPISVGLVWLSNPLTTVPMSTIAYLIGRWILNTPPHPFQIELSLRWITSEFFSIYLPLLVGSIICGAILATLGYGLVQLIWRYLVIKSWRNRFTHKKSK